MADAWEISERIINKGYGLDWDEDVLPDNKHPGDDISLIDEYRGFLVEDEQYKQVHQRFSANTKDLVCVALADKSHYGQQYKAAVRKGVFGYGKVTTVKMHYLSNSAYGQAEPGIKTDYGRWVNWNSPLEHHTDGVVIYCFDVQNPAGVGDSEEAVFKRQSLASTGPIFEMTKDYLGGQPPSQTNYVMMWTYDIIHFNEQVNNARTWYLPKSKAGNDKFNQEVNRHVMHANTYFGKHIDTLTMGTLVDAQADINIGRLIAATVAHEICHATGIHHHHLGQKWGDYFGVSSCPMRYWFAEDTEGDHADWIPMFLTGIWDPSTETTPEGDNMKLCPKDDNCFSQLRLKKE